MNDMLATGQMRCYDATGGEIPCVDSGQDAEFFNASLCDYSKASKSDTRVTANITLTCA